MAKISNTGSYPLGTPVDSDYVIGTEASTLETKNYSLGDIAGLDGPDPLGAVLLVGNTANAPSIGTGVSSIILQNDGVTELQLNPIVAGSMGNGDIIAAGDVTVGGYFSLVGQFRSPAGFDLDILSLGVNDDISISAGATSGSINMSGAGITGSADAIDFTATTGDIMLRANTGDASLRGGDKAFMAGNGSSYGAQPAGTTMIYNQNDDIIINASAGQITLGGTYSNRPTGVDIGPIDGDIDVWAFSGGSKINLTANGGIDSLSVHNFAANNGVTLAGAAGASGEVIASEGVGGPLAWRTPISLLSLTTSNVFTGNALNTPTATDLMLLDLTPAVGSPDITIGRTAPSTLTLQNSRYYAAVTHPFGDLNLSYGLDSLEKSLLTGTFNTALGLGALEEVLTGNDNTGVGYRAGAGTQTSSHNTALGSNALAGVAPNAVGDYNVAIGSGSMKFMNSNTANFNTAVGTLSLGSLTTGSGNISIGHDAGFGITTGSANIAIGRDSMLTGSVNARGNVVIGERAAQNINRNDNVVIGSNSAVALVNGLNNVIVGAAANVSAPADSGAVAIGSATVAGQVSIAIGDSATAVADSIAIGATAQALAPNSIALGRLSASPNPNTININVSGGAAPAPFGGIINVPVGAALPPIGVGLGDMYVVTGVVLPGSPFPCNVVCIDG